MHTSSLNYIKTIKNITFYDSNLALSASVALTVNNLPRPQALIKKFHASHYMKGLHEVVHRDEQAQGVMGLSLRAYNVMHNFM
jgi:hypothetical protein